MVKNIVMLISLLEHADAENDGVFEVEALQAETNIAMKVVHNIGFIFVIEKFLYVVSYVLRRT